MTTQTNRNHKQTSKLIATLFDGQAISFVQTDIIIQELMKRNALSVFDYIEFHANNHDSFSSLDLSELQQIDKELMSITLRVKDLISKRGL